MDDAPSICHSPCILQLIKEHPPQCGSKAKASSDWTDVSGDNLHHQPGGIGHDLIDTDRDTKSKSESGARLS